MTACLHILKTKLLVLLLVSAALPTGLAVASHITFVQEDISYNDTSIVKNDNVLVAIFPGSSATRTVNGVDIKGIGSDASGASYTKNGITLGWGPITSGGSFQYSLDPDALYENGGWGTKIMDNGIISGKLSNGGQIPIQISGLTVGENYRVQLLMDWPASNRTMEVMHDTQSSGVFSVGSNAGHGTSVTAYFTADAPSIDFSLIGADASYQRAVFNAAIVSNALIPEPSSLILLGLAVGLIGCWGAGRPVRRAKVGSPPF